MSKTIPIALQTHKGQATSTTTTLLRVGPLPDASYLGFSGLDTNVAYNSGDGVGSVDYIARTGAQISAMQASADLGVDNAEAQSLPPVDLYPLEGITQQQIDAGELDRCPWVLYLVNYEALGDGHEVIGSGTVGELRSKHGQLNIIELRSLAQQYKQTIGELDSLTCRVRKFGSQVGEERFPCEYDLTGEWVAGTVTAVGVETDLNFTDSALAQVADYFAPGVVDWLTGDNAGQKKEVDSFAASVVGLAYPTVNPITIGDTFRIRRNCTRNWVGHNSCDTFHGVNKPLHFRGEPHIPVADIGKLNTPGAGTSGFIGGTGETTAAT